MTQRLVLLLLLMGSPALNAASFRFESSSDPNNGLSAGAKTDGGATLMFAAAPQGAVLDVRNSGLGINSRGVAAGADGEVDKFNLLGGALAGQTESLTFSFSAPGQITSLDFDGVKDESFEFFRLESSSSVYSIFDSQIGLRLVDLSLIDEPNVTLLTEEGAADDDLFGIAIPFAAGEVFTLSYGEYTPDPANYQPGFSPLSGNGARFQGLTVEFVPEPATTLLTAIAASGAGLLSRHPRRSGGPLRRSA